MNLCHSLEINRFNPPYICACPKPGPGFLTTYSLRLDVFVRSVDIGGKADHHFLDFHVMLIFLPRSTIF